MHLWYHKEVRHWTQIYNPSKKEKLVQHDGLRLAAPHKAGNPQDIGVAQIEKYACEPKRAPKNCMRVQKVLYSCHK